MFEAGAVDVLQADLTRCAGVTGFLAVAVLIRYRYPRIARRRCPLHPCGAITPLRHLEYFHDRVRIERLLFDGAQEPVALGRRLFSKAAFGQDIQWKGR